MSGPNPLLVGAAPVLISALQAVQQFEVDIGPDPAQWPIKVEPAKLKLLGALGLLLPALVVSEVQAGEGVINKTTSGWITKLQALQQSAAAAPSAPASPLAGS